MSSIVIWVFCIVIMALIVNGSIYVLREMFSEDTRPYYWDETRTDLTETQQQALLTHASNRRLKRVLLEIDAQRMSKDECN